LFQREVTAKLEKSDGDASTNPVLPSLNKNGINKSFDIEASTNGICQMVE